MSGGHLGPPFGLTGVDRVAGQGERAAGAQVVVEGALLHRPQPLPPELRHRQRAVRRDAGGGPGRVVGVQGACDVEVGQRRPNADPVAGAALQRAHRGSRQALAEQHLLDVAGQDRMRADLEEHPFARLDQRVDRIAEPHRPADVLEANTPRPSPAR